MGSGMFRNYLLWSLSWSQMLSHLFPFLFLGVGISWSGIILLVLVVFSLFNPAITLQFNPLTIPSVTLLNRPLNPTLVSGNWKSPTKYAIFGGACVKTLLPQRRICLSEDVLPPTFVQLVILKLNPQNIFCFTAHGLGQFWLGSSFPFIGSHGPPNSAIKWSSLIMDSMSKPDACDTLSSVAFIAWHIAWHIWKSRNEFIFQHVPVNPTAKAKFAIWEFENSPVRTLVHMDITIRVRTSRLGSGLSCS